VRIVGGRAKGRRLAPAGAGTRPTSDRAREALFNSLRGLTPLAGTRLLDLYAGTGAVGLEALSEGASEVVFVESARTALAVLRRNIDLVGLPGAQAVARPVAAYLRTAPEHPFDLVFADPPYSLDDDVLAAVLAALAEPGWLADDAIVVVERSARGSAPRWPPPLECVQQRRYGEGTLWYGRRR
jgi:16S rRNA (guanine966-N2)-methyltransferase